MALSPPQPVSNGTTTYIMLTFGAVCLAWGMKHMKYMSSDNAQIMTVIAITLGFAMWMLWLCAWMHQWHPLIKPEWADEE